MLQMGADDWAQQSQQLAKYVSLCETTHPLLAPKLTTIQRCACPSIWSIEEQTTRRSKSSITSRLCLQSVRREGTLDLGLPH